MFNRNNSIPWHMSQQMAQNTILISDSEDSDDADGSDPMQVEYPGRQIPQQRTIGYNHPGPSISAYHTTIEQEKRVRSRLREERHAALCVLLDRELLTLQALAAQETLPQARRRFLAKLMAPEDPDVAASIRADQFTIQRPSSIRPTSSSPSSSSLHTSSNVEHMNVSKAVSRSIVDVCETDDAGWRRPDPESMTGATASASASAGGSSGISSPVSGSKSKGKMTPDRTRAKARTSSGRQQQRERRRRWSGAERQDHGVSMHGFPS